MENIIIFMESIISTLFFMVMLGIIGLIILGIIFFVSKNKHSISPPSQTKQRESAPQTKQQKPVPPTPDSDCIVMRRAAEIEQYITTESEQIAQIVDSGQGHGPLLPKFMLLLGQNDDLKKRAVSVQPGTPAFENWLVDMVKNIKSIFLYEKTSIFYNDNNFIFDQHFGLALVLINDIDIAYPSRNLTEGWISSNHPVQQEVKRHLYKAIEYKPDGSKGAAFRHLGVAYYRERNPKEALIWLQKAKDEDSNNSDYLICNLQSPP